MNRVQFVFQTRNLNVTKLMVPPKNRTDTKLWLNAARKVIPQIPDLKTRRDWFIYREVITQESILLELNNTIGERCALIIERRSAMDRPNSTLGK